MSWVYVKYLYPCSSEKNSYPKKESVQVDRVFNYEADKIKNRSFQIQCGEKNNFCEAMIAFAAGE